MEMKNLLVVLMFIFPVNAAIPSIIGGNLIDRTCRQTPYYNLCVRTLLANPHSFDTDEEGLATIMVYNIEVKATHTLNHINKLLDERHLEPKVRKALGSCGQRYNVVLRADIPQAIKALQTGRYRFAEQASYDAATEAMTCEEDFTGKSPLADMNVMVHDISIVAASIIKNIQRSSAVVSR